MIVPLSEVGFEALIDQRRQSLRRVADGGHRIIGCVYPSFPVELFLAHKLLPSVLWADPSVPSAFEGSLQTFCCGFARNLFSQRADNLLEPLSALFFPGNRCDSLQNLGDIWRFRFPEDKVLRLNYPSSKKSEAAIKYLAEELQLLSRAIEGFFGHPFSQKEFSRAVGLTAQFRASTQFIAAARLLQPQVLPYGEYAELICQFLTTPTPESLTQLEDTVATIRQALDETQQITTTEALGYALLHQDFDDFTSSPNTSSPRIAVIGGMVDPAAFAALFYKAASETAPNAEIVVDLLSFSFRTVFAHPPRLQGNPFEEIAKSLLSHFTEPTQEGLSERLIFLEKILEKFAIDGLIICEQSFCDPDGFEAPATTSIAEKAGIPTIRLYLDAEFSDRARLESKIQSFLETLTMR